MEPGLDTAGRRRRTRLPRAAASLASAGALLGAACAPVPPPEPEPGAATSPAELHSARPGETACEAAGRLGVSPEALLAASGIDAPPEAHLPEGARLRRPRDAPLRHRVARGETLGRLARHYGVSLRELASENGIADPGRIRAGRWLRIPPGARTGCPPATRRAARPREVAAPPPAERERAPHAAVLSEADTVLERARARYDAADFEAAAALADAAEELLEPLPDGAEADARRARAAWLGGLALTGLGRRREAVDRFGVAVALDPELAADATLSPKVRALVDEARAP